MVCEKGRFNTGNDLCSNDLRDTSDNTKVLDGYVNSEDHYVKDRLGTERLTLAGIEAKVDGRADDVIGKFEGEIDAIIKDAGGVEIVQDLGDSDSKVLSQNAVSNIIKSNLVGYLSDRSELNGNKYSAIYIKEFQKGSGLGGCLYVYDDSLSRSRANGGTIIDPTIIFSGDLASYLNAQGNNESAGCYVSVDNTLDVTLFGAGVNSDNDNAAMRKIFNYCKRKDDCHILIKDNIDVHIKSLSSFLMQNSNFTFEINGKFIVEGVFGFGWYPETKDETGRHTNITIKGKGVVETKGAGSFWHNDVWHVENVTLEGLTFIKPLVSGHFLDLASARNVMVRCNTILGSNITERTLIEFIQTDNDRVGNNGFKGIGDEFKGNFTGERGVRDLRFKGNVFKPHADGSFPPIPIGNHGTVECKTPVNFYIEDNEFTNIIRGKDDGNYVAILPMPCANGIYILRNKVTIDSTYMNRFVSAYNSVLSVDVRGDFVVKDNIVNIDSLNTDIGYFIASPLGALSSSVNVSNNIFNYKNGACEFIVGGVTPVLGLPVDITLKSNKIYTDRTARLILYTKSSSSKDNPQYDTSNVTLSISDNTVNTKNTISFNRVCELRGFDKFGTVVFNDNTIVSFKTQSTNITLVSVSAKLNTLIVTHNVAGTKGTLYPNLDPDGGFSADTKIVESNFIGR